MAKPNPFAKEKAEDKKDKKKMSPAQFKKDEAKEMKMGKEPMKGKKKC